MSEWSGLTLEKTFELNFCPDASELIKDTIPSHLRSALGFNRLIPARSNRSGANAGLYQRHENKCIIRYLTELYGEVKQEVDKIWAENFDRNDMWYLTCRKEKEYKRLGRNFTVQTYKARLCQTAGEMNMLRLV